MTANFAPVPVFKNDLVHQVEIGGFVFTESNHSPLQKIESHAHELVTINILMKGFFEEKLGRRIESCEESSVLIRPAGEMHADQLGKMGGYNLVIEIKNDCLESLKPYTSVLNSVSQHLDVRVINISEQIHTELRIKDLAATLSLEGLSLELLAALSRSDVFTHNRKNNPPRWLIEIRDLLHDRLSEPLRLGDLAAIAHIHPVYLSRAFRIHYGCTPGRYLRRLRIMWAAKQLVNSTETISSISLLAGFADQSHFSRAFKKETGMTPLQYVKFKA